MAAKIPSDLDRVARAKWRELVFSVDPDSDLECLANYCRQHSSLLALRKEKATLMKAGKFQTTVKGRDKSKMLNPMLTQETRLVASLDKMLRTLGLATSRDTVGKKQQSAAQDHAKWMYEVECILSTYTMSNALRHAMMERTGLPYLDCCDDRQYTEEDQKRAEVLLRQRVM
jgi:phage terminase small subunit